MVTQTTVVAVATASALLAAGGVLALAKHAPPPRPEPILRGADGHFWADATASSDRGRAHIHFLVDTGASSVALTADDARRLGLMPEKLIYSRPVLTAQGETRAAPVVLSRIAVAGAEVRDVKALVLRGGPKTSLLGMSYLGRLSRIEATPDAMTLRR
jgi:aspartyl protease family protein